MILKTTTILITIMTTLLLIVGCESIFDLSLQAVRTHPNPNPTSPRPLKTATQTSTLTSTTPSFLSLNSFIKTERDLIPSHFSLSPGLENSEKQSPCLNLRYILHDKLCMLAKKPPASSTERDRDIADISYILTKHPDAVGNISWSWIPLYLCKNFVDCYDAFSPNDLITDYFARALWLSEYDWLGDYLWDKWSNGKGEEDGKHTVPTMPENNGMGSLWFWTRIFRRWRGT